MTTSNDEGSSRLDDHTVLSIMADYRRYIREFQSTSAALTFGVIALYAGVKFGSSGGTGSFALVLAALVPTIVLFTGAALAYGYGEARLFVFHLEEEIRVNSEVADKNYNGELEGKNSTAHPEFKFKEPTFVRTLGLWVLAGIGTAGSILIVLVWSEVF